MAAHTLHLLAVKSLAHIFRLMEQILCFSSHQPVYLPGSKGKEETWKAYQFLWVPIWQLHISLLLFSSHFQAAFLFACCNKFSIYESLVRKRNIRVFQSTMQGEGNQVKVLKRTLGFVVTN